MLRLKITWGTILVKGSLSWPLWSNFPDFWRGAWSFCWKDPSPFLNCQPAGIPATPTPKAQHCWLTHSASVWNMQQIVIDSGMMALGLPGTIRWWPGMITWLSGLRWEIEVPVAFGGMGLDPQRGLEPTASDLWVPRVQQGQNCHETEACEWWHLCCVSLWYSIYVALKRIPRHIPLELCPLSTGAGDCGLRPLMTATWPLLSIHFLLCSICLKGTSNSFIEVCVESQATVQRGSCIWKRAGRAGGVGGVSLQLGG